MVEGQANTGLEPDFPSLRGVGVAGRCHRII
jgi:hypothetical protein